MSDSTTVRLDPELPARSRRLALAVNSPYFYPPVPDEGDLGAHMALALERDLELGTLRSWARQETDPATWPEDVRAILARAEAVPLPEAEKSVEVKVVVRRGLTYLPVRARVDGVSYADEAHLGLAEAGVPDGEYRREMPASLLAGLRGRLVLPGGQQMLTLTWPGGVHEPPAVERRQWDGRGRREFAAWIS